MDDSTQQRPKFGGYGALVLAGGGVVGLAWETGVLRGIQDLEPRTAEKLLAPTTLLVGTSAGASLAAQVAGGASLEWLFSGQLSDNTSEIFVKADPAAFATTMAGKLVGVASPEEARRRLGEVAVAADTPSTSARRAVIESRLPVQTWPDRSLLITALDVETGELAVFDRNSGVGLVDAVMASCAVPGVWPVVEIDGRLYMDGGFRTPANADLAAGADPVLIITPSTEQTPMGPTVPQTEIDALSPAKVRVIYADAASIESFGANPQDPANRRPAALAGRAVGRAFAAAIAAQWA
jgi:NTE family protein